MKYLNNDELYSIEGGAAKIGIFAVIGAVVSFIIGAFGGYSNPTKCNNLG